MKRNLRGEMTVVAKEDISILDFELIESVAQELRLSSTEVNTCNKVILIYRSKAKHTRIVETMSRQRSS